MVRAATLGAVDFSQCDPLDARWWTRLNWILDEIQIQSDTDIAKLSNAHWIAHYSNQRITPESADDCRQLGINSLLRVYRLAYPWMADTFGDEAGQSEGDRTLAEYRAEYGQPGEERYDEMIARSKSVLARALAKQKRQQVAAGTR